MNNIRDKFEKQIAIMEANLIHDNDAYFEARPNINTDGYKTIFNAGYKRSWQAATEQSQKEIAELQAREKALVELAKLTYGYLWHINAGLDAPAILNVTSITPEKCSHIVRKLWLDVLTKEQRGEGINKALEALANVRGD